MAKRDFDDTKSIIHLPDPDEDRRKQIRTNKHSKTPDTDIQLPLRLHPEILGRQALHLADEDRWETDSVDSEDALFWTMEEELEDFEAEAEELHEDLQELFEKPLETVSELTAYTGEWETGTDDSKESLGPSHAGVRDEFDDFIDEEDCEMQDFEAKETIATLTAERDAALAQAHALTQDIRLLESEAKQDAQEIERLSALAEYLKDQVGGCTTHRGGRERKNIRVVATLKVPAWKNIPLNCKILRYVFDRYMIVEGLEIIYEKDSNGRTDPENDMQVKIEGVLKAEYNKAVAYQCGCLKSEGVVEKWLQESVVDVWKGDGMLALAEWWVRGQSGA